MRIIDRWNNLSNKQKAVWIALPALLLIGVYFLLKGGVETAGPQETQDKVSVVVAGIAERTFERYVTVQGNLESKNFAVVSPRMPGTIEEFYVDEGDSVVEGKTRLFKTDSVKLEEAVEIDRHLLEVANCAGQEAAANLEKTEADFQKADLDYHRFERLLEKKAVTADAFEQQQSRYKQLAAAVKLAEASVELTAANVEKAEADLAISRKDLTDSIIYAPITGKISRRFKEPGEMGQPGEPVVRIDDTALIEVSAYLPAQYYAEVTSGQTMIEVVVSGRDIGQFPVSYKSPTINPALRTFEVKCRVDNSSQAVAAGAMANIRVILEKRQGLGVPSTSIQHRGGKAVVFSVSDNKAHKAEVRTGIEDQGWTEVLSDVLNKQSMVVIMGQDMLDEGRLVSVQEEGK